MLIFQPLHKKDTYSYSYYPKPVDWLIFASLPELHGDDLTFQHFSSVNQPGAIFVDQFS
jgi:hypothetical protein